METFKKLLDKLKDKRYSKYMNMIRNIFYIIGIFAILSCRNTEKTIGNMSEETNSVLIKDISNYLNENKVKLLDNELFYNSNDVQNFFFNKRFDYFIAILDNNDEIKMDYYESAREYFRSFPVRSSYSSYYQSKDIFDIGLFELLEKEFGEIELPMKYLHEYYVDGPIFYRRLEE
jgi:hypothetical protein